MKLAVLFLLAPLASAQYADLSGDWRISSDDNPRYADTAFDDSAWKTVRLPWEQARPIGVYWLRRTIDLPGPISEQHALAIGSVNETYRLYANGSLIVETPGFGSSDPPYFRPRVVLLGSTPSSKLVIAIRVWRPLPTLWLRQYYSEDRGPYLLAPASAASDAVRKADLEIAFRASTFLFFGPFSIFIAAYLLWTFRTAREWRELAWLGLFFVCNSGLNFQTFVLNNGGSTSWVRFQILTNVTFALALACFWEFATAVLRIKPGLWRWLAWLPLPLALLQHQFPASLPSPAILPSVLCALWGYFGLRRNDQKRVIALWIAIYGLFRINFFLELILPFSTTSLDLVTGPVRWHSAAVLNTAVGTTLMFLTLRRLLHDKNEKHRLSGELEAARTVQQMLLASTAVETGDYEIHAVYEPAQEVGGDFYQLLESAGGSVMVIAGDVSGKGLKAAMLVSLITGVLRREDRRQPAAVLDGLNRVLTPEMAGGFVTCLCARLEPDGRVVIANAGQLAPYSNGVEIEIPNNLPLGVSPDTAYEEARFTLASGHRLTLLSDGVVEAQSPSGELFGFNRTRAISGEPAASIADAAKAWGQNDDITVVTVRRRS